MTETDTSAAEAAEHQPTSDDRIRQVIEHLRDEASGHAPTHLIADAYECTCGNELPCPTPTAVNDGIAAIEALLAERDQARAELERLRAEQRPPRLPDGPGDRDRAVWCWAPNPNGPLHCGRLARHDGPHQRGERQWRDADTEATDG